MQFMHDMRTKQKSLLYQQNVYVIQVTWRPAYQPFILWRRTCFTFRIWFHALYFRSLWHIRFVFVSAYWTLFFLVCTQEHMITIRSITHYPFAQGMIIFAFGFIYLKINVVYMLFACRAIDRYHMTNSILLQYKASTFLRL
jgi:hypothetical protein